LRARFKYSAKELKGLLLLLLLFVVVVAAATAARVIEFLKGRETLETRTRSKVNELNEKDFILLSWLVN